MFLLPLTILALAADPKAQSEAVELKTDTSTLAGVLDLPSTPGPWPVVLIHAGSGPTDKDGNNPLGSKTNALKLLGHALAEGGIACLRIDKRGIGGSQRAMGKPEELRLETYVADAAAWLKFLRADKRFIKVGCVGHSEGSLIGILAGQKEKLDAFISLCGPGRRFSDILREQLKHQLPEGARKPTEALIQSLEAGKTFDDVPKEVPKKVALVFHKNAQQMLISMFKYDPAEEVGKLACPVLVVSGNDKGQCSQKLVLSEVADKIGPGGTGKKFSNVCNAHITRAFNHGPYTAKVPGVPIRLLPRHESGPQSRGGFRGH